MKARVMGGGGQVVDVQRVVGIALLQQALGPAPAAAGFPGAARHGRGTVSMRKPVGKIGGGKFVRRPAGAHRRMEVTQQNDGRMDRRQTAKRCPCSWISCPTRS